MDIEGNGFSINSRYTEAVNRLLNDVKGIESIKNDVPNEVMLRVISHPDVTVFASSTDLVGGVSLPRVVGPYKVHNVDFSYICTVNLHKNLFGITFPEYDYFLKLSQWSTLYVSYIDLDGKFRNIQIIKKD